MKGKIIIDGNKNKVESKSNLIISYYESELSIYNNVILCNNLNKISKSTVEYGSAICAFKSKINIYGGEISNNFLEMNANKTNSDEANFPENMQKDYSFEVRGAGMDLMFSKLYLYGGIICNNEGIINSDIYSNKNYTNNNSKGYGIYQRCFGSAIFAEDHS